MRVCLFLTLLLASMAILQFQLVRVPHISKQFHPHPTLCLNQSDIKMDYREVCYQKDIAYTVQCRRNNMDYLLAVDFTTPLSWYKADKCHISQTKKRCAQVQTHSLRQKMAAIKVALKPLPDADTSDIVIEGSSEVVKGSQMDSNAGLWFVSRDSTMLSNFFNLLLVGLYVYGEKAEYQIMSTNFLQAQSISQNTNMLSDGALSLRQDTDAEGSFLKAMFEFTNSAEKTVAVYLGNNNYTLVIGDQTAKYAEKGYAGIVWVPLQEVTNYGNMPLVTALSLEDSKRDKRESVEVQLSVVFTLSASYIALPASTIKSLFDKIKKQAECIVNNDSFVECKCKKKNINTVLNMDFILQFQQSSMSLLLKQLVVSKNKDTVVFNIKNATGDKYMIVGQPMFFKYYILFDLHKNLVGFAEARKSEMQTFISVVSLVHLVVFVFLTGFCLILCVQPCRKMLSVFNRRIVLNTPKGKEGSRLRQYQPIQENPYDQLPNKIGNALLREDNSNAI